MLGSVRANAAWLSDSTIPEEIRVLLEPYLGNTELRCAIPLDSLNVPNDENPSDLPAISAQNEALGLSWTRRATGWNGLAPLTRCR